MDLDEKTKFRQKKYESNMKDRAKNKYDEAFKPIARVKKERRPNEAKRSWNNDDE